MSNLIKERAINYGVKSLMDWEAVSLLTGINTEKLNEFSNLNDLRDKIDILEITELQKVKLKAIFDVSKRINRSKNDKYRISSPNDVALAVMEEMRYLKKEYFKIILLDTKNNILKISDISVGSLNSSIVHPREVFKEAVINSASSIILVHNHPSGDPDPSREDTVITNRLDEVGKMMGIRVIDHIIIGDGVFYSFKEEGLL